jgi:N6-adenosine-specific RNA methylase IME4
VARRGEHSAKPECFLEMIEQYFPTLPKIEVNRLGPPRPGWDAWGNEADTDAGRDILSRQSV